MARPFLKTVQGKTPNVEEQGGCRLRAAVL
jgi:hypothetical protein